MSDQVLEDAVEAKIDEVVEVLNREEDDTERMWLVCRVLFRTVMETAPGLIEMLGCLEEVKLGVRQAIEEEGEDEDEDDGGGEA